MSSVSGASEADPVWIDTAASAANGMYRAAGLAAPDEDATGLMAGVGQGCKRSFARLYRLTAPRLWGTVLRIIPVRAEAEEVLQETYLKVWNERTRFDATKGHALWWLLAIARHCAIDSLRRHQARPALTPAGDTDEPGEIYVAFAATELGPAELASRRQSGDAVQVLLGHLTDAQRQMLSLAFYEGLSHSEIALRLGCPLGTVKSTLRRALLSLRAGLAAHG